MVCLVADLVNSVEYGVCFTWLRGLAGVAGCVLAAVVRALCLLVWVWLITFVLLGLWLIAFVLLGLVIRDCWCGFVMVGASLYLFCCWCFR